MKTFNLKSGMMSLALVFLVGFWGCNDENVDYKGPSVEVDQTSLTFETGGGKQILTVKSNRNWEATLEGTDVGTWLQMSPAQGSGDGKIEVTLDADGKIIEDREQEVDWL